MTKYDDNVPGGDDSYSRLHCPDGVMASICIQTRLTRVFIVFHPAGEEAAQIALVKDFKWLLFSDVVMW